MMERLRDFGTLPLVTVEADRRLVLDGADLVVPRMNAMAVGAGNAAALVRPGVPCALNRVRMATETNLILARRRSCRVRAESHDRRSRLAAAHSPGMRTTGAVAGFALQVSRRKRRIRSGARAMQGLEEGQDFGPVVTLDAGVGTVPAV